MKIFQFVWFLVLAMLLPGFVSNAFGQDEQPLAKRSALQADRPDKTDSPFTLDQGDIQLEMGWSYTEHGDGSDVDSHQFPQTLLRYGLETDWELRFGWDGYSFVDDADDVASDISLGLKWHWLDQTESMPAMGFLGEVILPTGHNGEDVDVRAAYLWSWKIDDVSSVTGNLGIGSMTDPDTDHRFCQGSFSVSYNRSLNDELNWFGEYYTNFPAAEDKDAEHVVQTGFTYLVNPDLSFDILVGAGLNHQAPDFVFGLGLSYRF